MPSVACLQENQVLQEVSQRMVKVPHTGVSQLVYRCVWGRWLYQHRRWKVLMENLPCCAFIPSWLLTHSHASVSLAGWSSYSGWPYMNINLSRAACSCSEAAYCHTALINVSILNPDMAAGWGQGDIHHKDGYPWPSLCHVSLDLSCSMLFVSPD